MIDKILATIGFIVAPIVFTVSLFLIYIWKESKMLQDKIFATMQAIVNSRAYPFLLGTFMAFVFAYLIYKGI